MLLGLQNILIVFIFGRFVQIKTQEVFLPWSTWAPSGTSATRERSRECIPDNDIICTSNYFKEVYTNCTISECNGASAFINRKSSVCSGICDSGTAVVSFQCQHELSCRYELIYQCINHRTCADTWSQWTEVGCSQYCDGGLSNFVRFCTGQDGNSSIACLGSLASSVEIFQNGSCNTEPCPAFGPWTTTSPCSAICNRGLQTRVRDCFVENSKSNATEDGCGSANTTQLYSCQAQSCFEYSSPINGSCSKTCGGGTFVSTRTCHDNGTVSTLCPGANADGQLVEVLPCNTHACPEYVQLTQSSCSVSCGGGEILITRQCMYNGNPSALCSDSDAQGQMETSLACNTDPCPNMFGPWSSFTPCPVSCGGGIQSRSRRCLNGSLLSGTNVLCGSMTEAIQHEMRACETQACPIYIHLYDGACSVTCGSGHLLRTRLCMYRKSASVLCPGADMNGMNNTIESCFLKACPLAPFTASIGSFVGPIVANLSIFGALVGVVFKLRPHFKSTKKGDDTEERLIDEDPDPDDNEDGNVISGSEFWIAGAYSGVGSEPFSAPTTSSKETAKAQNVKEGECSKQEQKNVNEDSQKQKVEDKEDKLNKVVVKEQILKSAEKAMMKIEKSAQEALAAVGALSTLPESLIPMRGLGHLASRGKSRNETGGCKKQEPVKSKERQNTEEDRNMAALNEYLSMMENSEFFEN
ncbi:unnamed protein product [Clavelina lepadiformis]|uniref:Uncharacterized protein n=1 Tax=Clavelina lepadiformis TaxID=159417 RepID=A0ABP0FR16_CLALP